VSGSIDASTYVDDLPFAWTIPGGLALGVIVAVPAAVGAAATPRRLAWAPMVHPVVAALLTGWMVVQVAFIGLVSALQPIMFAWGALILALGWREWRGAGATG
jgi:hypothetical protein